MAGRKPTPTHLKLVKGNPGKRPTNAAVEPQPARLEPPPPPAHLTPIAAETWAKLAPIVAGIGVLTECDIMALERLCETYAELRLAQVAIEMRGGPTYEHAGTDGNRMRRAHPEVAQAADADRRFRAWLSEFGLTPAARSKVSAPGRADKDDPINRYFG